MKFKKSKHIKRWLYYYRIKFDFHYPYKVLVDGNFVKIATDRQFDLKEKLQKWLKAKVYIYVTSCVLQELNALPEEYRYVFQEAKKIGKLKCGHIAGVSPKECFLELIGKHNDQKYMVCSQDVEMRRELRRVGGVPTFFFSLDIKFDIEEPTRTVQKIQRDLEKDKYLPSTQERALIAPIKQEEKEKKITKKRQEFEKERNYMAVNVKRKALGPNPLSIKKKNRVEGDKTQQNATNAEEDAGNEQQDVDGNAQEGAGGASNKRKRKRNRKRTHKKAQASAPQGQGGDPDGEDEDAEEDA